MKFQWRPWRTAPKDGSCFVSLRIITHCQASWLPKMPTTSVPDCLVMYRHRFSKDSDGHWSWTMSPDMKHSGSVPYMEIPTVERDHAHRLFYGNGWWMPIEEYAAAIETLPPWRDAPTESHLVFVRPWRHHFWDPKAETMWHRDGWHSARTFGSTSCHSDYLDGLNVSAAPFRWVPFAEFMPDGVK